MKIYNYHTTPLAIEKIESLFEKVYGKSFNRAYWEWRFLKNPFTDKVYISYILDEDELIAYYAVSPTKLFVNGDIKNVALSMMTMTHPEYSGRGFFRQLAQNVYSELKADNFYCVYGFANTNSHYGFKKYLNWHDLQQMINLRYECIKENKSTDKYEHIKFDPNLWQNEEKNSIHIIKTIENIKWRVDSNPSINYLQFLTKNKSIFIYKIFRDVEIDLVFYSSSDLDFENDIREFTKVLGNYYSINTWMNMHSLRYQVLEKHNYKPTVFNSYFGIIPLNCDQSVFDYKNWDIDMIDSDIF